jgi:purine nucleosidase
MKNILWILLLVLISRNVLGQEKINHKSLGLFDGNTVKPRMRLIIDNDFGGDPDGLFELVQHLLSPSVEIRGIIGSHLKPGDGFDNSNSTAKNAKNKVLELLKIMKLEHNYDVYQGSNEGLKDLNTPQQSEAVAFIVKEAMREDTKLPLYVVCGAGLTDLASAYLSEPKIADRLTLIWIGGSEYSDIASPPPGYTSLEYNLGIDIKAGQIIFNNSQIPIWQIPRDAYRQVLLPYSSLLLKVKNQGETGDFLGKSVEKIMSSLTSVNYLIGETYILGDSPLVLLTSLQSSFEADPSSSQYVLRPSPLINEQGLYEVNTKGRNIRVYKKLDVGLLMEDFYSKLTLFQQIKSSAK